MAWLDSWAKRREITVSNTNIDSDLTHFPLNLFLNTSAGTGGTDVSSIFTELGANSLKIAVTKDDGTTQIYAEIEEWDNTNNKAVVWVSSSTLTFSSTGTTTLYIYYDNAQADNTTYVGANGSRTEVWDSGYKGVWHLPEASGTRIDSTSNDNDLTDNNTVTSGTGQIDGAADFELDNSEYLSRADTAAISITGDITLEVIVKHETLPGGVSPLNRQAYLGKWSSSGTAQRSYMFYIMGAAGVYTLEFSHTDNGLDQDALTQVITPSTGVFFHASVSWNASTGDTKFYINGAQVGSTQQGIDTAIFDGTAPLFIGALPNDAATWFMDGIIDEARISNLERSASYMKAKYNASTDNLVSYGSEEVYTPSTGDNAIFFGCNF